MSAASGPVATVVAHVEREWVETLLPSLFDYVAIPCVSKAYDPEWEAHGHLAAAIDHVGAWCRSRRVAGMTVEVERLPGLTPVIVIDVPAFGDLPPERAAETVLMYGHVDKQPEMTGWREGLGPWTPVVEDDRLYGRGGADDGYAAYASLLAIEAAQVAGIAHARCLILIEASEESGSPDLPAYVTALRERIGTPSLVVCLDGGCIDTARMWTTTSLRGLASGELRVEVLREGIHSGEASGVVASSFRILRHLLDRIEDSATGEVLVPECHVPIPADRLAQAAETAAMHEVASALPFVDGVRPVSADPVEQLLAQTWRPTISTTGVDGIPPLDRAGNVLRPSTAVALSVRLPPTCDSAAALAAIERRLTADPPYGARVTFGNTRHADGWNAPAFEPWLTAALDTASTATFGAPARSYGEGGSIPFMGMLGEQFPAAQFVVTGVLEPGTNAHGPNEYLPLAAARRLTAALALVLRAHATR